MTWRGWQSRLFRPLALKSQEPSLSGLGREGSGGERRPPAPGALLALRAGLRLPRPFRLGAEWAGFASPLPASRPPPPPPPAESPRPARREAGWEAPSRESGLSTAVPSRPPSRVPDLPRSLALPGSHSQPPRLPHFPCLSWILPLPSAARAGLGWT